MSIKRNFWLVVILGFGLIACKSPKSLSSNTKGSQKKEKVSSSRKNLSEKEQMIFEYTFFEAQKFKMLGDHEKALGAFLEALGIDETNDAVLYEIAQIYTITDRLSEALLFINSATEEDPDNHWYQILKAEIFQKKGRFDDEAEVYHQLLKKMPDDIDLHYACAAAHIEGRQYQDALKVYNSLEKRVGVSEEVSIQKERLYILLGDVEKAANEIHVLIEKNPKELRYYGLLAELYTANDMEDKAAENYQKILKIDSNEPRANLAMADIYKNRGEEEKSFGHLIKAFESTELEMDNKWPILVSFFRLSEQYPSYNTKTNRLLEIAKRLHPDDPAVYALSGDLKNRDGDKEGALVSYRKAAELGIDQFVVYNQILLLNYELEAYENVIVEAESIIEKFPLQPTVYLIKGTAEILLERHEDAVATFKAGVDFVVDNPNMKAQFYASMGDGFHSLKNHTKSDDAYEKSLKYFPDNPNVLNNYSYYLSLRKEKLSDAERMSLKSNQLMPNISSYQDTYAWILFLQKKYDESKVWFEKALSNGGSASAVIVEHYGDLLFHMGDIEGALEQWNKALGIPGEDSGLIEKKIKNKKYYE